MPRTADHERPGAQRSAPGPTHAPGRTAEQNEDVVPWQPARAWLEAVDPVGESRDRHASHVDRRPTVTAGREPDTRSGRHRRPMPPGPRLLTLPSSLVGARLSAPRAAVLGLVVVVALAAAGFGVRVAWARAASAPQVVAPAQPGSALVSHSAAAGTGFASSTTASGGGGPPAAGAAGPTAAGVTVHVVGQVRRPGVFELPAGARVADAVAKAGGALEGADLASVNLARVLTDGEQVHIPKPGEVVVAPPGGATGGAAAGGSAGGAGTAGGGSAGGAGAGGALDLNTATAAQLEELPGVGPVLAQRIVDWRTEHGRFTSVDELGEVSGIGEKIFAELQPKVRV